MGQGCRGVGGGVSGKGVSEKAFTDMAALGSVTRTLRKSLSGGQKQEGYPWRKKQSRGAQTWADVSLSEWALEGTTGKAVLASPIFAGLGRPYHSTTWDECADTASVRDPPGSEAEVRRWPRPAPMQFQKQLSCSLHYQHFTKPRATPTQPSVSKKKIDYIRPFVLPLKPWQQKFVQNSNSSREFYGSPGKPNSQNSQKVRTGRDLSDALQPSPLAEEARKP